MAKMNKKKRLDSMTDESPENRRYFFIAAAIALLTFAIYLPALKNEFLVNWDEDIYILDNLRIRSMGLDFFKWAFLDYKTNLWHPLTWISHALDYAIWGLNPFGHHLTSIILHAVNTVVVIFLTARIMKCAEGEHLSSAISRRILIVSAVTGLLFGIHPIHVESVVWAAERKDLLYSLFYMLSIIFYIRYTTTSQSALTPDTLFLNRSYLISLFLFLLSLTSKPMAVTLPLILLLLDRYPLQRFDKTKDILLLIMEKIPFFLLSAAVSVITVIAQKDAGGLKTFYEAPITFRFFLAVKSLFLYLYNIAAPSKLFPLYLYPTDHSLLKPDFFIYLFLLIAFSIFLYWKKTRFLTAAWLGFIIMLLPVLGFFQAGGQAMADRFIYLASVPLFIFIGLLTAYSFSSISTFKSACLIFIAAWMIFLACTTIRQISHWKNAATLWSYQINSTPASDATIYLLRAVAFEKQGMLDKALNDYATLLAVNTKFDQIYINRGALFLNSGQYDKAIEDYTTAIKLSPDNANVLNNRGKAYRLSGKPEMALKDIDKAIAINSRFYQAYINRGNTLASIGQSDKAIKEYTDALTIKPDLPDALYSRGELYLAAGSKDIAAKDFQKACQMGVQAACIKTLIPF